MIRRPPRSTRVRSSAASDVYKRQEQEKEMVISVNDKTAYENVKSVIEIKLHDAVSIDYVLGAGGMNLAKEISIEKPEEPDTAAGK